jgi:ABC-type branched-subunit amino acid transport system ATPase component
MPVQGTIHFNGSEIQSLPADEIVRRGVALVPEGTQMFAPDRSRIYAWAHTCAAI